MKYTLTEEYDTLYLNAGESPTDECASMEYIPERDSFSNAFSSRIYTDAIIIRIFDADCSEEAQIKARIIFKILS